jgi:hypothetical protein
LFAKLVLIKRDGGVQCKKPFEEGISNQALLTTIVQCKKKISPKLKKTDDIMANQAFISSSSSPHPLKRVYKHHNVDASSAAMISHSYSTVVVLFRIKI